MNYRSTYILFGLVALVLILLAVALIRTPGTEPSKYVLPVLQDKASPVAPKDITRIQIERGSEKIDLTRQGTAWKVNEFRASDLAVNQLLSELFDAQREKADKPDNLSLWGLAPPTGFVKLFRGDNLVAELQLGKTGPANSLYVLDPTRPDEPMVVRKTSLEALLLPVNGFRERTLLGSAGTFSRIELSETEPKKPGEKPAEPATERKLVLEESSGTWRVVEPFTGLAASDGAERRSKDGAPSNVPSLEHDLADLQPGPPESNSADYVANNVKSEDFAKYYLDPAKNKVLSIKVTRQGEPKQVELLIGLDKPADDKGEFYYARLTNEPNIVRVPSKQVKALIALLQDPQALRDYHLVRFGPGQTVDALKIELRDQEKPVTLEFFRPMPTASPHAELGKPAAWQFYIGDQAQGLDQRYLEGLLNLLTQDNIITSFPKDDKGSGLDKPKVVVTVYYGGTITTLKQGQKPTIADAKSIILRFAALEKPDSWASREQDKTTTIVKVRDLLRERVGEGPLAYRSKDLVPYKNPDDAKAFESKLTIQRGGKVETVARAKADEPWKFVAPPTAAGYKVNTSAVQGVLRFLTSLQADNNEREKPDAKTLQEWGFSDPQITKVTVTVTGSDGKTSDHTYEFAKEKDPTSVYARQSDRPDLIFSVAKSRVDQGLLKAELRDLTIFSFKPDKVNRLNLDVGDKRHTQIHLEKKDGEWTDKDNPKLTPKLDADKIRQLLVQMGTLQAQSFVAGAVDPTKSGLKPEDGALVITAFVEGEEKPYILTVGKSDGMETYATSNRLPEDDKQPREVFKVRKYLFDNDEGKPSLKTDPGYLYKD